MLSSETKSSPKYLRSHSESLQRAAHKWIGQSFRHCSHLRALYIQASIDHQWLPLPARTIRWVHPGSHPTVPSLAFSEALLYGRNSSTCLWAILWRVVLSVAKLQVFFRRIGAAQPVSATTFGLHLQLRGIEWDHCMVAHPFRPILWPVPAVHGFRTQPSPHRIIITRRKPSERTEWRQSSG